MQVNDYLKVHHGGLELTSDDLFAAAGRIEARLERLEQDLNGLRGRWTGAANEAYDVARREWEEAMRDMKLLLAAIGGTVARSNAAYRAADLRGSARFGGLG